MIQTLIRTDPPLRTAATAVYPWSLDVSRKYRFTSRFGDEVLLYEQDRTDPSLVHLPRGLCPPGPNDQRDPGTPVTYPKKPVPRPHQVQLFSELADVLHAGLSGVVSAPTGWGKTLLGYHAAATLGVRTLVVTTKDDIYKQWLAGAQTFLGLPAHHVGEIRGDYCEVIDTKFVVAMIHSLSKDGRYPDWIVNGFGLVIFDECHRVPAEHFMAVASMFPAKIRLGLSATPSRSDGKELLVHAHIGPLRAEATAQMLVPKVMRFTSAWECPRVIRPDPVTGQKRVVRLPHSAGKTMAVDKSLAADPVRNHLLGQLIQTAYEKGRKLVVFSSLHEHLNALHRICREVHGIPSRDIGMYIGAQTKADRESRDRQKARPILLTTYSMMSEGTDIPWLDTCLLAIPRANVTQTVGRIRREYPDKPQPVVLDVVDLDSPVYSGYTASRLRWYRSLEAQVLEM